MNPSTFSALDFDSLEPPRVLDPKTADEILEEWRADFKANNPNLADSVDFESEPIAAQNRAWAYREYNLRRYFEQLFKQGFLAFATGNSLDHHAALIPLPRNPDESDDDFRARIQFAPEGYSTAGPPGGYIFHTKSVSPDILDVYVSPATRETAGEVHVYVLTALDSDGDIILNNVRAALSPKIRPLNDFVTVHAGEKIDYKIEVSLEFSNGFDNTGIAETVKARLEDYAQSRLRFGAPIYRSAIAAACVIAGVENVVISAPAMDITPPVTGYGLLSSLNVLVGA